MPSNFASSMFPSNINVDKQNIFFVAAGSLGMPLALCSTRKGLGWKHLYTELKDKFSAKSYKVVNITHNPETFFPLGTPLTIQVPHLFDIFNLRQLQEKTQMLPANYKLDHVIWICPSGIILIIGKISFNDDKVKIDLKKLNQSMFKDHYAELGYVLNEITEIVVETLPAEFLKPPLCSTKDIKRIKDGVRLRANLRESNSSKIIDWLTSNSEAQKIFADSILDVYFMHYHPNNDLVLSEDKPGYQVRYFDALFTAPEPEYLLMVCIAYSSFVGLLWLVRHLGEQVEILQTNMIGKTYLNSNASSSLKLFRIFCLRFISESNPISIRLETSYMNCLESCREPYRMKENIAQVNEQLTTLEKIADWIDDNNNAIRDRKINLAAVTLAIVSITAVAAQLISTLDVNSQLSGTERSIFILVGFLVGGILSLLGTLLLPALGTKPSSRSKKVSGSE